MTGNTHTKDRAVDSALPLPPSARVASEHQRSRWAWPSGALFVVVVSLGLWALIFALLSLVL
jgi:hypothetical protein